VSCQFAATGLDSSVSCQLSDRLWAGLLSFYSW